MCVCVWKSRRWGCRAKGVWGVFPWLLWHGKVYTSVIVELWPPEKVGSACLVCEYGKAPCVTCLLECQACLPLQQITMIDSDGPLLLLIAPLYTPSPPYKAISKRPGPLTIKLQSENIQRHFFHTFFHNLSINLHRITHRNNWPDKTRCFTTILKIKNL